MNDLQMKEIFCRPTDERALISYCMRDITNYFAVCSKLSPKDFLYSQHEMTMFLFEQLAAKGAEKFETTLIISEATAAGVLDSVGGIQYIKTIANINLANSNFNVYLKSVCESVAKYKLYSLLTERIDMVKSNAKDGIDSLELISSVEASVLGLSMSGLNIDEPKNLADGLGEYIESLRESKVDLRGVSTGYPILDKQIDGLVSGTVMVVAARKKKGKSTFLSNIALHVAYVLDTPVLYVDTEMSFPEWRSRALSTISGVKERDITHGGYDDIIYNRLKDSQTTIEKGRLFHEYMPGYSVDKLVALYRKYKQKENIGLMVFDYLKEPDSTSIERQRKEYQVLGDVTTKLKDLAGQLDIPALTAVQLNRNNDVADSDRIARYADIVCFWGVREAEEVDAGGYDCGSHKLVIKDTRRGGTTSKEGIGYMFFKEFLRIKEVPADKQHFTTFNRVINADGAAGQSDSEKYDSNEIY